MVIPLTGLLLMLCTYTVAQKTTSRSLTAKNGQFIGFLEFRPGDYESRYKHPLIIFLHGVGELGNGRGDLSKIHCCGLPSYIRRGHNMRFTWNGKTETFVVLMPQLATKFNEWQSFYVNEMIDYAVKNLNIDPDRIFVTGLSLGGGGTWAYASESQSNSRRLAGIVPVVGPCRMTNGCNIAKAALPVLAVHARDDKTASPLCTTDAINAINGCGATATPNLIMYPDGGHAVWLKRAYSTDHAYQNPNVYEWMLAQNKALHPNKKPKAKAGADVTVNSSNAVVTLDGTGSTDPDGKILRYAWRRIAGPARATANNPSGTKTTLDGLEKVGTYRFELKVVDDRAEWTADTVNVIVNVAVPSNNKPPVANAGADKTVSSATTSIMADASASYDEDGSVVQYEWSFVSGPAQPAIVQPDSVSTEIKELVEGTYQIRLMVTDDKGKTDADTLRIHVTDDAAVVADDDNMPPVAIAGSDTVISSSPEYFVLDGSRSHDDDGTIIRYVWRRISGENVHIETADKPVTKVKVNGPGVYTFELIVTDNSNKKGVDTVEVTYLSGDRSAATLVYPNPASNTVRVNLVNDDRGEITFALYDATGRRLLEKKTQKSQQSLFVELPVASFNRGTYYLQISGRASNQVQKLIKKY